MGGIEREYQNTTAIAGQATSRLERKKSNAALHALGLLWPLDCAVHDLFGGVATEERWVGAKAPGGDATAEERGYPVDLGRGRWWVVGGRASQETDC